MTDTATPDYSELPRAKMRKLKIAFDVDGTLRCNCTDTCEDPNEDIIELLHILNRSFKNIELWIWSGGGADYARRFRDKFRLPVADRRCISKFGAPQFDACIDDIQDTNLTPLNLIVRMK